MYYHIIDMRCFDANRIPRFVPSPLFWFSSGLARELQVMDFAKKLLNKYGWKEGDGLGKHGNGIAKPLKATLKFDNAGLGADVAASDFNNRWWERIFNDAAQNVQMETKAGGVIAVEVKDSEAVEISTKGYSMRKLKKAKESKDGERSDAQYDNFLQSSTLTNFGNEIENANKIGAADIAVQKYVALTDEELFQACGGRTAHKGARHGLKLSGKLARIEQQELELLEKMQKGILGKDPKGLERQEQKKGKEPIDEKNILEESSSSSGKTNEDNCQEEELNVKKKKKKRKNKEQNCQADDPSEEIPQKLNETKTRSDDSEQVLRIYENGRLDSLPVSEESAEPQEKKKKTKKRKDPQLRVDVEVNITIDPNTDEEPKKKKKKRKETPVIENV